MNEYYEDEFREVFGDDRSPNRATRRVWLNWEDIRYLEPLHRGIIWGSASYGYDKPKLQGIWGSAGPGEIVAIVGGSRCGKSLLLKILAGNVRMKRGDLLDGRVLINGFKRGQRWRRMCAHVTQSQEELHGSLKVEEQLKFRAQLALPSKWTSERRTKVIQWVLGALDLQEVSQWRVSKLNLAERKKLSIGLALVGLPRVLLLDEPTDGIDPTTALELMKTLKRITQQRQMTTIITAKQMRLTAARLIDRFLIISHGGTVFYGTLPDATAYLRENLHVAIDANEGENPLNSMLDAINCKDCRRDREHVERIHQTWKNYVFDTQMHRPNLPADAIDDNDEFVWHRGWLVEFKEQLWRSWLLLFRNHLYLLGQTLLALTLALIVAFSAFQLDGKVGSIRARLSVLFYTAVFFQFFPFIPFLFVCYRDKWVLTRERRDSACRVGPAYLSSWVVIYTFRFLLVTMYTCIVYFIVGLRLPFNYTLVFWLTLLAEAWVAMGMGYLIVTLVPKMEIAETMASFILLIFIWFSGDFSVNSVCTWILRWICYLSPIFYSFNALINNEFDDNIFPSEAPGVSTVDGDTFLSQTGYDNFGLWPSIGALLGFGLLYMILGYIALAFTTRPRSKYI